MSKATQPQPLPPLPGEIGYQMIEDLRSPASLQVPPRATCMWARCHIADVRVLLGDDPVMLLSAGAIPVCFTGAGGIHRLKFVEVAGGEDHTHAILEAKFFVDDTEATRMAAGQARIRAKLR